MAPSLHLGSSALHMNDSKEGSQYWPNYALWYGQIPLDFMTRPSQTWCEFGEIRQE